MLAFVAVLVLAPMSVAADQQATRQLLQQAEAAASTGKIDVAESMVCAASAKEPKNADLRVKCDSYHQLAQTQREADHKRLNKGAADFAMKNFDSAESEFRAIESASYANLKKDWLEKVAQARTQSEKEAQSKEQERKLAEDAARQKAAQADSAMQADLNRAIAAYEKNDFVEARKLLSAVSGAYQAQAQKFITNIDQYNRAIKEGVRLEKAGELGPALTAYQRAVAIKANGPENPKEKIANLRQAMPQFESAATTDSTQDQVLRSAIQAYYQSDYGVTEQQLSGFKASSPKLDALAHFYLGASRLSQYFMASDEAKRKQLWDSAIADLQSAKHTPDFVAPKSVVSPKVMEVYETSVR